MNRKKGGSGKKGGSMIKVKQEIVSQIKKSDNETIVPKGFRPNKTSYFEIDVIKKSQKGFTYFSGELSLSQLAALTKVDTYDGNQADVDGKGQRILNEARGLKFYDFISYGQNICLAELLLNDRDGMSAEFISLKDMNIEVAQYPKISSTHGVLKISSDSILYVYDGQTRRFGYLSLLHFDEEMLGTDAYKELKRLKIPFCLSQVSASEETDLFLQHNKQTSVPNDHKAMVSWHINKEKPDMKNYTHAEKTRSVIAGMTYLMDRDRTNPWYKRISMPDLSLEENKKRLGGQGSFNTGLKRFVGWLNKNYWSPETSYSEKSDDLVDICTTFWRSIQKCCPKIWRTPENYIQLKSLGIATLSLLMHTLYIDFFDRNIDWNIENLSIYIKKSNIITTPRLWEVGGELQRRGGGYKALETLQRDIYDQMRKN